MNKLGHTGAGVFVNFDSDAAGNITRTYLRR